MRLFKSTICTSLVLFSFTLLFAGCSPADQKVSNPDASKPVKLRWVMAGPGKQEDSDVVWGKFNEGLGQFLPNTTVDIEVIPFSDFNEKWKLLAAASEPIDIAWTGYTTPYFEEVNKGSYMALDELMQKYTKDLYSQTNKFLWDAARVNGKIYSVPNYQQMVSWRNTLRLHQELIEKYKIDVNKIEKVGISNETMTQPVYDAMEEYLSVLKNNNELRQGVGPLFALMDKGYEWVAKPYYIRVKGNDFNVSNIYELAEYKTFIKNMADWYKKGYIRSDVLSIQNPRQYENKEDGYVMWVHTFLEGSQRKSTTEQIAKMKEEGYKKTYPIQYVPIEDANYYIPFQQNATSLAIPRTSKNPDRAIKVIELMNLESGKDLYNLLVYGIEGQHYKKLEGGKIETIGYVGTPTAKSKYGLIKWATGNTMNAFETRADTMTNAQIKKLNDSATPSRLMGFKLNTDPIKNELAQVRAVEGEYSKGLNFGAFDDYENRYEEFIDKMKTAGSDKIAAEMKKQIEEWAKTKGN